MVKCVTSIFGRSSDVFIYCTVGEWFCNSFLFLAMFNKHLQGTVHPQTHTYGHNPEDITKAIQIGIGNNSTLSNWGWRLLFLGTVDTGCQNCAFAGQAQIWVGISQKGEGVTSVRVQMESSADQKKSYVSTEGRSMPILLGLVRKQKILFQFLYIVCIAAMHFAYVTDAITRAVRALCCYITEKG